MRQPAVPLAEGVVGHVYRTKEAVHIGDILDDELFRDIVIPHGEVTMRSEVCVPSGATAAGSSMSRTS
jgi:GAF domain-containing protein